MDDALDRGVDISGIYELDSITLKTFPYPHVLGMCYYTDSKIAIVKPEGPAANFSKFHYLMIIYHELGHCVLKKLHTCNKIGIMNPSFKVNNVQPYFINWEYLVDDYWDNRGMTCLPGRLNNTPILSCCTYQSK